MRHPPVVVIALLPLFAAPLVPGCSVDPILIEVSGTLYDCGDPDTCGTVAGATVQILDVEETVRAEDVTGDDGGFRLSDVPGSSVVFIVADMPDEDTYVPTSFLGQTGTLDGDIPDGSMYVVPSDEAAALVATYDATHPDGAMDFTLDTEVADSGGMVRGRFLVPVEGASSDSWPSASGVSCLFESADGGVHDCVYRDFDGDPDWTMATTSIDGRWASFGLPAGLTTGALMDGPADTAEYYALFYAYIVEDGITVFDYFPIPF